MSAAVLPSLDQFLRTMIPLSGAMGVRVEPEEGEALVLTAPLAPNRNALNTAFGGSLAALATLAGYGVMWELMQQDGAGLSGYRIVIKEGKTTYRRPVAGELRAICARPSGLVVTAFREALARYGQARLTLHPRIVEDGQVAVDCRSTYVVVRQAA